ncbi:response regulator with CheY-like receiver domain and winged-helix DNA-binding domain [Halobacteroides halobius DSM 5150]|uniref:Stage 0 sporulation protein A homolog n=1 Tax=Halobacteroides halobius (strain ATCC 35273 / DSM 5150 / MD-1) TaxID=748449 RepID=L0K8F1_HALHC|nr:response regulator transcription factor [Halobacteroides halobius]AGB40398.1 response regulator with CheY-like receiver domain and winged-helix DNA-binding domain [Halobacteroides halobius DSM 5150]
MNLHGKEILLIEDDQHIFSLIEAMLKPYDVNLTFEKDGMKGLEMALFNNYHLILLDIMLPKKDGWEVCRQLKNSGIDTPIIMLTAKVEEADKVLGLEMGADDYVTKPFSPRELIARIKAVLRRFEKTKKVKTETRLQFPKINLEINLKSYDVYVKGSKVMVAPKEFELLSFLASHPNEAFSREDLLDQIWDNNSKQTRTVDEHIKRLRKKLTAAGLKDIPLETVWGIGYKFEIEDEKKNEV